MLEGAVIPDGVGGWLSGWVDDRMDGRTNRQTLPNFMTVGTAVSPTYQPPLLPRGYSWYSFLSEAESTLGTQCGRIMSMKNSNDAIGNRTRDLPARNALPQPTAPPRAPIVMWERPSLLLTDPRKYTASVKIICLQTTW